MGDRAGSIPVIRMKGSDLDGKRPYKPHKIKVFGGWDSLKTLIFCWEKGRKEGLAGRFDINGVETE